MKNLLKCHFNYLISKTTIIINLISILILLFGTISSIIMLDTNLNYNENNYLYFSNIFLITKLIIIILTIFLFGFSFLSKSDQYIVLILAAGVSRLKIIITKIFVLMIFILFICYLAYFQYFIVGYLGFENFIFEVSFLKSFFSLLLLAYYFGLFSLLFIQRFDNIYITIIPIALINLSEIINEKENLFVKIINFFIPYYSDKYSFYYGIIHILILIIILFIFNIYYYKSKDLKF